MVGTACYYDVGDAGLPENIVFWVIGIDRRHNDFKSIEKPDKCVFSMLVSSANPIHFCPEGAFCVGRAKKSMFVRPYVRPSSPY